MAAVDTMPGGGARASVGGPPGPAPTIPPPPPPLHRASNWENLKQPGDQHQQQPQQQRPPRASRYSTLRGKSVSSARRVKKGKDFDVFRDDENVDGKQTSHSLRRSKSVSSAGGNGAKDTGQPHPPLPTTNLPLNPKPVNVSSRPASSFVANTDASAKYKTPGPPRAAKLARRKDHNARPASRRKDDGGTDGQEPKRKDDGGTAGQEPKRKDGDEAAPWADEVARLEAETDRILAEQKKRDIARLQDHLASTPPPPPKPKPTRLILDKLSSLAKGSRSNAGGQPRTPKSAPAKTFTFNWSPTVTRRSPLPESMAAAIEPGGGGIVPQIDAPASASNAGQRHVTVQCCSSTIKLPVSTETSPVDIVQAAANLVTHNIDPETSIVVECYVFLGLERRLRRYERIRDVMNSWDRDAQCSLLVMSSDTARDYTDLDLASVPRTENPPTGFTFQLHHSCRPGKWNKRWVTLTESGQIFAAKRPESRITDKDSTVLCHLTDFDVYAPTDSELRHIKAPKKNCYAIKSQQKTNLFQNGENFVHFFSTEEQNLAHRFYELVHGWRSWYLVNKKLDLQSKEGATPSLTRSKTSVKKSSTSISRSNSHRARHSTDQAPYTIPDFKSVISMNQLIKPLEESGKGTSGARQSIDNQSKATPPKPQGQPPSLPETPQDEGEFLADGLLGEAYDKRKESDASTEAKSVEGPFTEGPSLLNNLPKSSTAPEKPPSQPWFPSALEHSARARSQEQQRPRTADGAQPPRREKPFPNGPNGYPEYHPVRPRPRQRPGVGRGVKAPPGAPLVDYATNNTSSNRPMPSRSPPRGGEAVMGDPTKGRRRSGSTSTTRSGGGVRYAQENRPPVPSLPLRSAKRPRERPEGRSRMPAEPTGRDPRPQKPLINRVK